MNSASQSSFQYTFAFIILRYINVLFDIYISYIFLDFFSKWFYKFITIFFNKKIHDSQDSKLLKTTMSQNMRYVFHEFFSSRLLEWQCTWHAIPITRLAARVKNTAGSIHVTIAVNWRPVEGDCPPSTPLIRRMPFFYGSSSFSWHMPARFPLMQGITSYIPTQGFKVASEDNPAS